MNQIKVWMAAAFLAASAGMVWADAAGDANKVNPQPLPPDGNQQVTGNNSGNGEDGLNPQPYPPKGKAGNAANQQKVGKEVVVGYEDGDPDKPITTGNGNAGKLTSKDMEGAGISYYFKHDDGKHTLVTGQGNDTVQPGSHYSQATLETRKAGGVNNGAVTTGATQASINTKGGKSHTKGSIVVMEKNGKNGSKSAKTSITDGTKGQFTGGLKNSFQKSNNALNGNLHNGAMGDGSVRGQ